MVWIRDQIIVSISEESLSYLSKGLNCLLTDSTNNMKIEIKVFTLLFQVTR